MGLMHAIQIHTNQLVGSSVPQSGWLNNESQSWRWGSLTATRFSQHRQARAKSARNDAALAKFTKTKERLSTHNTTTNLVIVPLIITLDCSNGSAKAVMEYSVYGRPQRKVDGSQP